MLKNLSVILSIALVLSILTLSGCGKKEAEDSDSEISSSVAVSENTSTEGSSTPSDNPSSDLPPVSSTVSDSSSSESDVPSSDFEYKETSTGLQITKYLGSAKNVTIPKIIGNKKVTSIAATAFGGNVVIESVTLPDNFTSLDLSIFKNCDSLKEVIWLGDVSEFNLSYDRTNVYVETISFKSLHFEKLSGISAIVWAFPSVKNIKIQNVSNYKPTKFITTPESFIMKQDDVKITLPDSAVRTILSYKTAIGPFADTMNRYFLYESSLSLENERVTEYTELSDADKICIMFKTNKITVNGQLYESEDVVL